MFGFIKKVIILIMSIPLISGYCLLLKNQECKVRKVIVDNDYMTFPYKIGVDRCIGSCNDKDNPYFKVFLPDSIKNISVKSLDLISQKNVLKNIFIKVVNVVVYYKKKFVIIFQNGIKINVDVNV